MRKSILHLLICMQFTAYSQNTFNAAVHDIAEYPFPFVTVIAGNYYFVTSKYDIYSFGACRLHKYDGSGNLMYIKTIPVGDDVVSQFKTLDGNLFIGAKGIYIDCFSQQNRISKYDPAGNTLFTHTLNLGPGISMNYVVEGMDSCFYAFTDSACYKYDKNGLLIKFSKPGTTQVTSAVALQSGNILISAKQNTLTSLIEMDTSVTVVGQYTAPLLYNKMEETPTGLICMAGIIYSFSPQYQVMSSTNYSLHIQDFALSDDTLYAICNDSQQEYLAFDLSLNVVHQASTSTQGIEQLAVCRNGGFTGILSSCRPDNAWNPNSHFASLNVIGSAGSNNFVPDVGVVSVSMDSMSVIAGTVYAFPNPLPALTVIMYPRLVVRNFGLSRIDSFKVNMFIHPGIHCGHDFFQKQIYQSLPAGGSVTVFPGTFVRYLVGSPTFTISNCFYTSVPNGCNDRLISNDGTCQALSIGVGISEIEGEEGIRVWPNPSSGNLNIQANKRISSVRISDLFGKEVISMQGEQYNINIEDLPSGIYFVQINAGNQRSVTKIFKE
jgi:hypothetical protein